MEPDPAASRPAPDERAFSVQLHLHGPFSEGPASVESQAQQAAELGVDVLWWSDHDYRVGCYRLVSSFGFEGLTEPIDLGESWSRRLPREDGNRKSLEPESDAAAQGNFDFTADQAFEGQHSLRVHATGSAPDFADYLLAWDADRGLHRRPMATGVELRLAALPERAGPDARGLIRLRLSEHPPDFEQHALEYLLVGEPGEPERSGGVYRVPVVVEDGRWNELALEPSADLRRGFPELVAGDDAMFGLELGVQSRDGAEASFLFDDLSVSSRRVGREGFEAQREVLAARNERELEGGTGLTHLQGVEISYEAYHLNEFGLETVPFDYDLAASESGLQDEDGRVSDVAGFRDYITRRAVEEAHARGALISFNHMFGAALEGSARRKSRKEVLAELRESGVFGADLLEVGYRDRGGAPLEDHLWVWDRLCRQGPFLIGVGVSDYHGGAGAQAWRVMANNFVSWIWAARPERAELLEGLRHGRVFFGDPARFDGTLDLWTPEGQRMGDVLVTDRTRGRVMLALEGLERGDRVSALGPSGVIEEWRASGRGEQRALEVSFVPGSDEGSSAGFVRIEAQRADGTALVFSNPIWFVPPGTAGLPGARVRIDVAGVRDLASRGVELGPVELLYGPERLRIGLAAADGELTLALPSSAPAERAVLAGIAGQLRAGDGELILTGLAGQGALELPLHP